VKPFTHLWQYLAEFFLEWEMLQTKVVEKMKTHIFCSIIVFRKLCHLWDNVENYGGARGTTNDVSTWSIWVACWISKATCTHAHAHAPRCAYTHTHTHTQQWVISIAFLWQQWLREHTWMLRYMYITCVVIIQGVSKKLGQTVFARLVVLTAMLECLCCLGCCTVFLGEWFHI
jgi:hypothetical protein